MCSPCWDGEGGWEGDDLGVLAPERQADFRKAELFSFDQSSVWRHEIHNETHIKAHC